MQWILSFSLWRDERMSNHNIMCDSLWSVLVWGRLSIESMSAIPYGPVLLLTLFFPSSSLCLFRLETGLFWVVIKGSVSVRWHRARHKREGGCWALWEITFFDPQSLSFVRSVSLSEFVSLKWSVYYVYNVKLMKLWIVSLHFFGVFSSTLRMTSLSVIPLCVCVCVCVSSMGVVLFS